MTTVYWWLALSALFFAAGEVCSKLWANGPPSWKLMLAATVAYLLGSLAWFPALRARNHLCTVGTLWSLGGLVVTVLVGAVLFSEPLTHRQLAGIVVAGLAVWLLA
jgi:multidrug transporter EmrE-like cation transporter